MAVSLGLGFSAGLLTLGLCALGAGLLVPLRGHPWLSSPADLIRMALYLVEGALVAILAVGLRAAAKVADTRPPLTDDSGLDPLTTRELEVLTLAATGLKTDEIARQLFVSKNTVKTHLARTYAKLGARNRAEAVTSALRIGVIELVPSERRPGPGLSDSLGGDRRQPPVPIPHGHPKIQQP
jgi:DNA-binding CsgD family transcriptional regulator